MSGLGGSAVASTLTMDGLLALADFVKNPQYIDRIRELQAAQVAHDHAAAEAAAQFKQASEAQTKLDAEIAAHKDAMAEKSNMQAAVKSELTTRSADLTKREADLKRKEDELSARVDTNARTYAASKATLDETAKRLNQLSADLDKRKTDLDKRAADLDRRLAKLREAAA
jgi:chromosome segregation ATPase